MIWRILKHWWLAPAHPLEFWMPQSGLLGGVVFGTLLYFLSRAVFA